MYEDWRAIQKRSHEQIYKPYIKLKQRSTTFFHRKDRRVITLWGAKENKQFNTEPKIEVVIQREGKPQLFILFSMNRGRDIEGG